MYRTVMDYKRIYEDIMNSDPKIRLVTICLENRKYIKLTFAKYTMREDE